MRAFKEQRFIMAGSSKKDSLWFIDYIVQKLSDYQYAYSRNKTILLQFDSILVPLSVSISIHALGAWLFQSDMCDVIVLLQREKICRNMIEPLYNRKDHSKTDNVKYILFATMPT